MITESGTKMRSEKRKMEGSILAEAEKKRDEFSEAATAANIVMPDNPEFNSLITHIFAFSDFIARNCIRHPEILDSLIRSGDLQRPYLPEEYHTRIAGLISGAADADMLGKILRQTRCREMIRIAWRDLSGRAALSETMRDLSDFADACLEHALFFLYRCQCETFGVPLGPDGSQQYLVILGMGKLGAHELNFSSDIDLIFAYPEAGETKQVAGGRRSPAETLSPPGRGQGEGESDAAAATPHPGPLPGGEREKTGFQHTVSNDEFFVRLCRNLLKVLGANTAEGILFRVDMGLRPYGESGPVVMSFDAMEAYYQMQGREWERYALIKARPAAGDKIQGAKLLERLNPFIYRKYLDFGVFESLRDMKRKISLEVRRKGMKENIKLGPGGIREIEFFGQIFQLIRGGVIPALQERCIQKVLEILAREKYIQPEVHKELEAAYIFLRNTEHRLQEFSDSQTHTLPPESSGKERLALSMGFADWNAFASVLEKHHRNVHRHFNSLLGSNHQHDTIINDLNAVWHNLLEKEKSRSILSQAGFENPDEVLQLLAHLRNDLETGSLSREGRERIDRLLPLILKEVTMFRKPADALDRIINLIKAIKRRTSYIALLLENPTALRHLIKFAGESSWILSFLTLHPVLLDELLDSRTLYFPPTRAEMEAELRHRLDERVQGYDFEHWMEELRLFKQINVLRVAAADVTNTIPLMKVSDYLSDIAETVLGEAVELSWNYLAEKHGHPICRLNGETFDRGFAIIAYGKLGGLELGYDSDLDLVFLHAGTEEETQGCQPVVGAHFFGRMGQRIIHILTTHTSAGSLYEADMRLRPSGTYGLLVSHADAFREYHLHQAWTWEKQAIIRARFVSGNARLGKRFEEIRREVLAQPREKGKLREEVANMREKMRKELSKHEPGIFDLKQDSGGIVDIEFLVQYLVLSESYQHPELLKWTDNVRLIGTLARTGVLDEITAYTLRTSYLTYRTVGHRLSLQKKPARVPEQRFRNLRGHVRRIWDMLIG